MNNPKTKCRNCKKKLSNRKIREKSPYCSVKCKRGYMAAHKKKGVMFYREELKKLRQNKEFMELFKRYRFLSNKIKKYARTREMNYYYTGTYYD